MPKAIRIVAFDRAGVVDSNGVKPLAPSCGPKSGNVTNSSTPALSTGSAIGIEICESELSGANVESLATRSAGWHMHRHPIPIAGVVCITWF